MINDQNFGILTFTNRRRSNLIRSWRGSATTLSHRWPKFRKRVKLSRKHGSISWGSHVITDQLMMRSILVTYASSLIHQSVTRVIVHQESPFTKGTKNLTLTSQWYINPYTDGMSTLLLFNNNIFWWSFPCFGLSNSS